MGLKLTSPEIGVLDLTDSDQVVAYERAFYEAFCRAKANQLIRDLWIWDDQGRRLRTRIPYGEQCIFTLRDSHQALQAAIAFNLSSHHYQASAFGFERPSIQPEATCEILTFFSTRRNKLSHLHRLLVATAQYFFREQVRWVDATCTQRLLPSYRHLGAELLASRQINDEYRHHLRFEVASFAGRHSLLRQGE